MYVCCCVSVGCSVDACVVVSPSWRARWAAQIHRPVWTPSDATASGGPSGAARCDALPVISLPLIIAACSAGPRSTAARPWATNRCPTTARHSTGRDGTERSGMCRPAGLVGSVAASYDSEIQRTHSGE